MPATKRAHRVVPLGTAFCQGPLSLDGPIEQALSSGELPVQSNLGRLYESITANQLTSIVLPRALITVPFLTMSYGGPVGLDDICSPTLLNRRRVFTAPRTPYRLRRNVLPIHSLHCLFNAVFVLVMANSLPHVVRR